VAASLARPAPEKVPIDAITNGVHVPSWLNHRIEALFDRYMDAVYPNWREDYDNPTIWEVVDEVADGELWREHQWLKMKLFARIRSGSASSGRAP
jgi:starch phosphorylase